MLGEEGEAQRERSMWFLDRCLTNSRRTRLISAVVIDAVVAKGAQIAPRVWENAVRRPLVKCL